MLAVLLAGTDTSGDGDRGRGAGVQFRVLWALEVWRRRGWVMADVFVSYARRDGDFVRTLAEELRARGKEVWVDVEGIRDADRFPDALRGAIQESDAFLFVISPDSVASEFCEIEVQYASELNKRIVPLALRPVPDEQIPDEV